MQYCFQCASVKLVGQLSATLQTELRKMARNVKSIPVNTMVDEAGTGIAIERFAAKDLQALYQALTYTSDQENEAHRHNAHSFFLLESGTVHLEIDSKSIRLHLHLLFIFTRNQVHHTIAFENVIVSSWSLNNENLNADYLNLLEGITPAKPLILQKETFSILSEAVALCLQIYEQKRGKLYQSLLKDSCNTLVALVLSQYLEQTGPTETLSRFETVTKAFKALLEKAYTTTKSPAAFARQLNISTPYLNECVKNTTGYPVTYHIQQRVILEAKRLLYHSNKSVKEIASALGYDDYPYFSRLFIKTTGITALAFRNKNHE